MGKFEPAERWEAPAFFTFSLKEKSSRGPTGRLYLQGGHQRLGLLRGEAAEALEKVLFCLKDSSLQHIEQRSKAAAAAERKALAAEQKKADVNPEEIELDMVLDPDLLPMNFNLHLIFNDFNGISGPLDLKHASRERLEAVHLRTRMKKRPRLRLHRRHLPLPLPCPRTPRRSSSMLKTSRKRPFLKRRLSQSDYVFTSYCGRSSAAGCPTCEPTFRRHRGC